MFVNGPNEIVFSYDLLARIARNPRSVFKDFCRCIALGQPGNATRMTKPYFNHFMRQQRKWTASIGSSVAAAIRRDA